MDRSIRIAEYGLGEAAVIKRAERTLAVRVIEFTEQAGALIDLVLEAVAEEPGRSFGSTQVWLLGVVITVFDTRRDLQIIEAEAYLHRTGEALRLRAGLRVP